jgi:N4-gp56 family major capsid protein
MANLAIGNFAADVKTLYETRLLDRALPRMIHGRWLDQARLSKRGAYECRRYGSLSAVTSPLVEGTTPAEQSAPSLTTVTITPSWYGAFIGYSDQMDMVSFDPYISEVSAILGEQCGQSADQIQRDYLVANATTDWAHDRSARNALTVNDVLTYKDLLKQIAQLEVDGANPPDGGAFPVILHPHSWTSLMQDPVFVQMFLKQNAGSNAIRNGYMGTILNMKFYITSNAKEWANSGANSTEDVYTMLIIGREAVGVVGFGGTLPSVPDNGGAGMGNATGQPIRPVEIIGKPLGSAGADDPLNQRGTLAWKMSLGLGVLNSAWIRSVEHCNDFSAE